MDENFSDACNFQKMKTVWIRNFVVSLYYPTTADFTENHRLCWHVQMPWFADFKKQSQVHDALYIRSFYSLATFAKNWSTRYFCVCLELWFEIIAWYYFAQRLNTKQFISLVFT